MRLPTRLLIALALVTAMTVHAAQKTDPASVMFEAARKKEIVDGDLNAAIQQYKTIAAKFASDRAVAADALLHMADCYQKLGDSESRKIYERIVRDYADQKQAAGAARSHLGGLAASAGIITKQVWTGPAATNLGRVSLDGRYIAFTDWDTGDLALHDLTSGQDRRVTNKGSWNDSPEYGLFPVFSRDGKQLAYFWLNHDQRSELRVCPLADCEKSRVVLGKPDIQYADVTDWSPDDKWLAVRIVRVDRTVQLGLLSVADGTLRVLKSIDWRGGFPFLFSPDGKYLAYDVPAAAGADQGDIYVIAADASHESGVVVHPANDTLLSWSPDGAYLLFDSDRSGSSGMWAVPIASGKADGEPKLVKQYVNTNPDGSMGITRSGALYYAVGGSDEDVYIASIDFETGKIISPPKRAAQQNVGSNGAPRWSPDGKHLSYLSFRQRPTGFNPVLAIYSPATGETRELKPGLQTLTHPFWSPDGRYVIGTGANRKNEQGIYRIDVQTGEAALLITGGPDQLVGRTSGLAGRAWSADGKSLILSRLDSKLKQQIVEHDLQSGQERNFSPNEPTGPADRPRPISPDGKLQAAIRVNPNAKSASLTVRRVAGGEPRDLWRISDPEVIRNVIWTPDGRYLVFVKGRAGDASRAELWRIPAEGGAAVKIDIPSFVADSIRIHPDNHRVAFTMAVGSNTEVWAMENILSALKPSR